MAYTAWSVVFGEQPTAAKWNQLGANDAGFKDGTNIDTGALIARHYAALSVGTAALAANGVTAAKIEAQQAWVAPTLTNSWVNYASGFNAAGYFKDSLGVVHMHGMIKNGTMGAAAFTLPVGYRPLAVCYIPAVSAGGLGIVSIDSTGVVKFDGGTNGYQSLDGVHFRAEA